MTRPDAPGVRWPNGKRFAFTIFDDTDQSTLENAPAVYDLITALGMRITKSVWPVEPAGPPLTGGTTCADPDYLAWVLGLQAAGHEIGYHNASDHPSTRAETIAALDTFESMFGHQPRVGADHAGNTEAMYLGKARITGPTGWVYHHGMQFLRPERGESEGHLADSAHFWGDVLQERIDYWRGFCFTELDALTTCPRMPYHDPDRPFVNHWFTSTHAPRLASFLEAVTPEALDRLEAAGGLCIIYTHFGVDFVDEEDGLSPAFRSTMEDIAGRDGWFAPVSEVLDHLLAERSDDAPLSAAERTRLERRWVADQLRVRGLHEVRRSIRRRWQARRPVPAS